MHIPSIIASFKPVIPEYLASHSFLAHHVINPTIHVSIFELQNNSINVLELHKMVYFRALKL